MLHPNSYFIHETSRIDPLRYDENLSARLVSEHHSTQSDGPPSEGEHDPPGVRLDPLFQEQLGLVLFLGQEASRVLRVDLGRGLLRTVRVERVGSLGSGFLGELEQGLVDRGDYGTRERVKVRVQYTWRARRRDESLTGEQRVRDGRGEEDDGAEQDSTEVSRVG